MLVLVSYDVSFEDPGGKRRLRRIARICTNYGQRVQYSVFECVVDPAQWAALRAQLLEAFDAAQDSLRFYFLGKNWQRRVEQHGAGQSYDPETDALIFSGIATLQCPGGCVSRRPPLRRTRDVFARLSARMGVL